MWLQRAEKAVGALAGLAGATPGPTADQLAGIGARAAGAIEGLRETAGQVTLVEQAIARIPSPQLAQRRDRLAGRLAAQTDPDLRAGTERTLADVDGQLASDGRLRAVRDGLLARMEAATLGLEGLVARAAEAAALAASMPGGGRDGEIAELTAELDGLRAGLTETGRLSRGGAGDTEGG